MKKKIMLYIMILCMIFLMTGCGESIKSEAELKEDLLNSSDISIYEGAEITNFSIIKRLTNKEEKTDTVYVEIKIELKEMVATQAYIMSYTCYNEGWLLDSVEIYEGNDAEWTMAPKSYPSNERIMELLIEYSKNQIDVFRENEYTSEQFKDIYFYEDGKYKSYIYGGEPVSERAYICIVETQRVFENVEVTEESVLYFVFNHETFEWELDQCDIKVSKGEWIIEGEWYAPLTGATIKLIDSGVSDREEYSEVHYFEGTYMIDGKNLAFTLEQHLPSSHKISSNSITIGGVKDEAWGDLIYSIEIAADGNLCYEWGTEKTFELEPINVEEHKIKLDVAGVMAKPIDKAAEPYVKMSKEIMDLLFIEKDMQKIEEKVHEDVIESETIPWADIKDGIEYLFSLQDVYVGSVLYTTLVVDNSEEEYKKLFDMFKEEGFNVQEIAMAGNVVFTWRDGELNYELLECVFIKEDGQVYFLGID